MKKILLLPFLFLFVLLLPVQGYCELKTGLEVSPMNDVDAQQLLHIFETKLYDSPIKNSKGIRTFAVNQHETKIALGFDDYRIEIYSDQGEFLYGYKTNLAQAYGLEYDEDDKLLISLSRNNCIFQIDDDGTFLGSYWIKKSSENTAYFSELTEQTEIERGDTIYQLSGQKTFAANYECIKIKNDETTVLYENRSKVTLGGTLMTILMIGAPLVILVLMLVLLKEKYKDLSKTKRNSDKDKPTTSLWGARTQPEPLVPHRGGRG